MIGRAARGVEALLLPRACLGCERALDPGEPRACCAVCLHRMRELAPPRCARCGQPVDAWILRLHGGGGSDGAGELAAREPASSHEARSGAAAGRGASRGGHSRCAFCSEWPDAVAWAASATWLDDGPARNLVHALKYAGWRRAAEPMAERVRAAAGARLRTVEALVPVPLGPARLRERGHNQAALLARALGALTGLPVVEDALRRTRETHSQTRLSPDGRRRNVAGAFAPGGHGARGLNVALVDDVLTTGATLGAAASALVQQLPASIGAVTFARALVPA